MNMKVIQNIKHRRKFKNNKTTEKRKKYRQLRNQVNRKVKKAKET